MGKDTEKKEQEIGFLEEIRRQFGDSSARPQQYSALALAYMGDSVYDLLIRTLVLNKGNGKVKEFHRATSGIVKAESQARLVESLLDDLTEEESAIYRHGRNAKSSTSAKNASIVDYRIATGFEALLGYLYLSGRMERAVCLVKTGLERTGLTPQK